jgi:hypothetical protein
VPLDLLIGVEAAAGVVEVDVTLPIESGQLCAAQLIERRGGGVLRVAVQEARRALGDAAQLGDDRNALLRGRLAGVTDREHRLRGWGP